MRENISMVPSMPSILVPYDATELSVKALSKAREIAAKMDYTILLLFIVDDTCFYPSKMVKFISNIEDLKKARACFIKSIKEGVEKHMVEEVNKLKKNNIAAEFIIKVGHPADQILATSRDENVNLIIMGSSGSLKKRHNRKGIGSISRWISDVAPCPVVLMR
jgi:nucleotide-binding universal stress UspA family protein